MDSKDKTAEQKLKDAAEKLLHKYGITQENNYDFFTSAVSYFIKGAQSEAAKEYWSQSQSSEIERLKAELEECKKEKKKHWDGWTQSLAVHKEHKAIYEEEISSLKKQILEGFSKHKTHNIGEVNLLEEISSLKSELLAGNRLCAKLTDTNREYEIQIAALKSQLEAKAVDVGDWTDDLIEAMMPNSIINEKLYGAIWMRDILLPHIQTGKSEEAFWTHVSKKPKELGLYVIQTMCGETRLTNYDGSKFFNDSMAKHNKNKAEYYSYVPFPPLPKFERQ